MTTPDPTCQPLGPEVTIAYAAATREQLLQSLAQSQGDLQLELSGVTDIDSAGVQLLLATHHSLRRRGHTLHLQAPSACVRQALSTFGLDGVFAPQA